MRSVDCETIHKDDAVADQPEPDMFEALAKPLPVQVISTLIGVPRERWPWMQEVSTEIVKLLNPFIAFDHRDVDRAIAEFDSYIQELAAERRREPADDLITALAEVEHEGDQLSETELVAMVAFLLFAGHETTTGLIGMSLIALGRNPDERRRLMDDPSMWDTAVEELIRWDSPVQVDPRGLIVETEIGGVPIKPGDAITLMLGAANRDPRVYTDPNTLRLDRDEATPLSFGHGIHYCIGAALARMEIRAAVSAVLDRYGEYQLNDDNIQWKTSLASRGPEAVLIRKTNR